MTWFNSLMHSTAFFVGTMLVGLAGFGGYAAYRHFENPPEVVSPVQPPAPPAPTPPVAPAPEAIAAITIAIHGPQPSFVINGVSTMLVAETTGPAGIPKWRIIPPSAGTIRKTSADGRRAELLANGPGVCSILVDVAGDGRQIANDEIEIEIVSLATEATEPSENRADTDKMPPVPPQQQPYSVSSLVSGALANVETDRKQEEAKAVAETIRSVVGRIKAGHIVPSADPMAEVTAQVNQRLGADAGKWQGFLISIDAIVEQLRQQGQITTAASSIPALTEIATAMAR